MEELHLFVYGEVGGIFGEGVTADEIQKEIQNNPDAKEIVVHISSPGGGVFEGWTIGNILKNSGKKTTARIEAFCASIATYIALSCDRVEMAETGRFMIHNPTLGLEGEEADMAKAQEQLSKIKDDLINIYRAKTGLSVNQLSKMMDEETWFDAKEAKSNGFVDGFMTPLKAVAKYDLKIDKMSKEKDLKAKESMLDSLLNKGRLILLN
jgi:ATP-dependent Clp protease protease subunit